VDTEEQNSAVKKKKKTKEAKEKPAKEKKGINLGFRKSKDKKKKKLFKSKEERLELKKQRKAKRKSKNKKLVNKILTSAANMISLHDKAQDFCLILIRKIAVAIVSQHHRNVKNLTVHRKELISTSIGLAVVLFVMFSVFNNNMIYSYSYNGRSLGYVEREDDVLKILELAGESLSEQTSSNVEIVPYENVTFKTVSAANKDVDDIDTVLKRLTYMTDLEVKAYGIYSGEELLVIVESQDKGLTTLSKVKEYYMPKDDNVEYLSAEFKEEIEFKEIDTTLVNVNTPSVAAEKLVNGEQTVINHVVKPSETYEEIASIYGISVNELLAQNSGVNQDTATEGETLFVVSVAPVLTLVTVEERVSAEEIGYETKEKESGYYYEGEEIVSIRGSKGKAITEARITRENGKETEQEIIRQEVLEEPTTEIILIGTKPVPPKQGTGEYTSPVKSGILTSGYGMRWGRMHYGIDLAAPVGTPLHAADGGTVTFAGYKGAYGYCIIIDHGANNETLYGHCNSLAVSVGDKVFKDQVIGTVGNSGRSTGPHCHFEVHINGSTVNPQLYL